MNCCVVNKETEKYGENSYCSQFCTNSLFTAIAVLKSQLSYIASEAVLSRNNVIG